jgi:hypothetical protein
LGEIGLALVFPTRQNAQRVCERPAGLSALKRNGSEQTGPKAPDATVAVEQFALVVVFGGSRQPFDQGHRLRESGPGDACEGQGSHPGRAASLVEQDGADVTELQSGRIQIAERAKSFLFSGELGLGQQVSDDQVQQVQGVVQRRGLEGSGKGQQGGDPPVPWHPRNHRRPGGGGMAGQGFEPTCGHP